VVKNVLLLACTPLAKHEGQLIYFFITFLIKSHFIVVGLNIRMDGELFNARSLGHDSNFNQHQISCLMCAKGWRQDEMRTNENNDVIRKHLNKKFQ
jgi:hypothetical protein